MNTAVTLVITLILAFSGTASGQTISIATADGPPLSNPDGSGFHDRIIREAFARIGMELAIVHLPAQRALINANNGIEEGVYVRIAGIDKLYPNLIRVPEKISEYEFVGFSRKVHFTTEGWDSLTSHAVGIVTGCKILERNIVATGELLKVSSPELLFGVLDKGRVDVIIHNRYDGYGVIDRLKLRDIHVLEPPLVVREMFLFMHASRKELATDLAHALRSIKADGTYRRLFQEIIEPLEPK